MHQITGQPPVSEAADPTNAVECLHCGTSTTATTRVRDTLVLAEHPAAVDGRRKRWCLGSFLPPVSGDAEVDEFSRRAVSQAQAHRDQAENLWDDGAANITNAHDGPRVGAILGVYLPQSMRSEELCQLWLRVAFCGDYLRPLWEMVATLAEVTPDGSYADGLQNEVARLAARDWIREMRMTLLRTFPDGLSAEHLAGFLGAF